MQGIEKEKREGKLNGINMSGKDPRRLIEELIMRIKKGDIAPETAWNAIKSAKEYYIRNIRNFTNVRDAEQSWHSYIGNKFQELIYGILKRYVEQLKEKDEKYRTLCVHDLLSILLPLKFYSQIVLTLLIGTTSLRKERERRESMRDKEGLGTARKSSPFLFIFH